MKLGGLGSIPGSREQPCSWARRARQLLHTASASQVFNAQQSFAHPRELAVQQKDLPREKRENSGIKQ